jgi:hypothetical protein
MGRGMIDRLNNALRDGTLIRFRRPFEAGSVHGYIDAVGPTFFAVALVGDRVRFDGFQCFRVEDVEGLETDPYTAFVEAALQARGEVRPQAPGLNLDSLPDLLISAGRIAPLVTIHTEADDPEVCFVGRVVSIEGGILWMLEIGPDAVWDADASAHRLDDITRVDFGGGYEQALDLVGGEPPAPVVRKVPPLRLVTDNG